MEREEIGRKRKPRVDYGEYAVLGPAIASPSYKPPQLKKWPRIMDFSNDNIYVKD